jgi:hypothetical protein
LRPFAPINETSYLSKKKKICNLLFGACRCIAVKTTLSEEILNTAGPSLIRNEIGNVSLDDILSGGSDGYSM